jgi:hypothetical protein
MTLKIQVLVWDMHTRVAVKRFIGSQHSPLDNLISNGNAHINKR